jgi:hypothetical protein
MTLSTLSQAPVPAYAQRKYADQWIAIRNGRVVAHADSLSALVENKRVHSDDVYHHVPPRATVFY